MWHAFISSSNSSATEPTAQVDVKVKGIDHNHSKETEGLWETMSAEQVKSMSVSDSLS